VNRSLSSASQASVTVTARRPRLGFLGVGWIGRHRLAAIADSGLAEIVAISDTSEPAAAAAIAMAPRAALSGSFDELVDAGIDGVVIATPSALHADQTIAALERKVAVFCQKPLGRTAGEARAAVVAAEAGDTLLGVDLSYRFVDAVRKVKELVESGGLGNIYAMDLTFHNAYGPDKAWFLDRGLSGGGCVIDLGTHLVDLALWMLGFPEVQRVEGRLFARGRLLQAVGATVEDHAIAQIDVRDGVVIRLTCSWFLPAGRDAVIEASVYGTTASASIHNVAGSFYDFIAEVHHGTASCLLAQPPDDWGGRAAVDWVTRLASGEGYSPEAEGFVAVAEVVDAIYGIKS
jgi:predicted dehydrogenase